MLNSVVSLILVLVGLSILGLTSVSLLLLCLKGFTIVLLMLNGVGVFPSTKVFKLPIILNDHAPILVLTFNRIIFVDQSLILNLSPDQESDLIQFL